MRRRLFLLAAALVAAVLVWSATSRPALARTPMSAGERLYRANCAACHRLIPPAKHTDEDWLKLVERYAGRLKLPAEKQAKILEYLTAAN